MEQVYLPAELGRLVSRGSQAEKPGSLAGLHETRKETLSQFFTPAWLTRYLWNVIQPAFDDQQRYRLLDNSLGNAGLFRFADPKRFHLCGLDVDEALLNQVIRIIDTTKFETDFVAAGMENVELDRFSAALINPPFSITLSSPHMHAYEGITHYGKHGPNTSALSHEYALAQALAHCDIVAAVVPASVMALVESIPAYRARLRAVFVLPRDTFQAENVESVNTVLLILGSEDQRNPAHGQRIVRETITPESIPPYLENLSCRTREELGKSTFPIRPVLVESSKAVVTTPLSDDKTVILGRAGRWIKLKFRDGATEGRVMNTLYRSRLYSTETHRYPRSTRYAGQFQINLDVISLQPDPFLALRQVSETIRAAGGQPIISTELIGGLKAIIRENAKMQIPFSRTVYRKGTPQFSAIAGKMGFIDPAEPVSVVRKGDTVQAKRESSGFVVTTSRGAFTCDEVRFFDYFVPQSEVIDAGYWETIYPPIAQSFPRDIDRLKIKAQALGIDRWLTWDFQLEDLCELAFKPRGAICAWQMALGKSRLAISLALLLEGRSLIVLKSRLVAEMENELQTLGFNDYTIIRERSDLSALNKLNVISYERLKRPFDPRYPKLTLAKALRKRIKNVICDEGGLLANQFSQQSQAVWCLGAKRRYIFDGTPFPNYVRESQSLAAFTAGQERAYQPFSLKGGFLERRLFTSAEFQPTGRDEFAKRYVTLEWATNEFKDTHERGAKREIPKINPAYLNDYRAWIAPLVKRRVQQEPDVAKYVHFPEPRLHPPIKVDWAIDHLVLYIKTAEEFASWYRQYAKAQQDRQKALNLTMILARLEACFKAANTPSIVSGYGRGFADLTTKERACIELVKQQVEQDLRPIVFARNPLVLRRLSKALDQSGISQLVFSGEETIDKRISRLNDRIRNGTDQVMLASLGVTQDGLNLPMLNSVIFYNRSYKAREESQAIYRLIRPQQKHPVNCYFLELAGSIDEYMSQLVSWKKIASEAGLDYGDQVDGADFVHFDAFIYRFINSIPELRETLACIKRAA